MRTVIITELEINQGMKNGCGLKRSQSAILGLPWPLVSGWKEDAIGLELTEEMFHKFVSLRDAKASKRRKHKRKKQLPKQ